MDSGSFRCELVGTGERGTVLRGRIAGRGDPVLASLLHQLIVRLLASRVMHLAEAMDGLQR